MKSYRPIFVFDLTEKTFKNEKELNKLVGKYPTLSCLLVSGDQKKTVAGFSGMACRYIDMSQSPWYSDMDGLVYDSSENSYLFATARDLERMGNTYRDEENVEMQSYIAMGMKAALETIKKHE